MRWEYRHAGGLTAWRLGPLAYGRAGSHWVVRLGRWVLVSHLLVLAAGCGAAGRYAPKTPEAAASYAHALATRALNVVRDAGSVASSLRRTVQALHDQRLISDAAYAAFEGRRCDVPPSPPPCRESGWLAVQRRADEAIVVIQKADVTGAQLAAALQPLYQTAEALVVPAGASDEARSLWGVLVAVVRSGLALVGVKV